MAWLRFSRCLGGRRDVVAYRADFFAQSVRIWISGGALDVMKRSFCECFVPGSTAGFPVAAVSGGFVQSVRVSFEVFLGRNQETAE